MQGNVYPFPTRTPIAEIVGKYVKHIRSLKTPKSAQTDVYYLRQAFGAICPELIITSRRVTENNRKRPLLPGIIQDLRKRPIAIESPCFEQITTAQVSAFISPNGQHWDCDNFSHTLPNANKHANLQWSCLDYRHTFGSQLAIKGESLYKISTMLGNSPEICRRLDAALLPESLTKAVEFGKPPASMPNIG